MRLVFAVLVFWCFAAAAEAACPAGSTQVGEQRTQSGNVVTVHPVCRRVPKCAGLPASAADVAREHAGLRRELEGNISEAARNAAAIEEWAAFGAKARETTRQRALGVATGAALSAALGRVQGVAKQRHLDARQAAGLQRDWGQVVTRLNRMSPTAKAHVLKPVNEARTAEQAVTALQQGIDVIGVSYDAGALAIEPDWEAFKAAALSSLQLTESLLYGNPATGLLITDLQAGENAVYGWWAALATRNRLRQLLALEDSLLAEAVRESNRYVVLSAAMAAIGRGEAYCAP